MKKIRYIYWVSLSEILCRESENPKLFQYFSGSAWYNSIANYRIHPDSFTRISRKEAMKIYTDAFSAIVRSQRHLENA